VDVVGIDKAIKIIQIFGGTKINVPSWTEFNKILKEYQTYKDVTDKKIDRKLIMEKYGISYSQMFNYAKKFKRLLDK